MPVKETTTFSIGNDLRVVVSGSDLGVESLTNGQVGPVPVWINVLSLSRGEARDLSKALSHAADIVRSKRTPK